MAKRAMPAMGPLWERNKVCSCCKALHRVTAEKAFHPRGGLMLPTAPRLTGLAIVNFVGWWSSPSHQSIPRRNLKTFHSSQLPGCSGSCLQRRGLTIVDTAQLPDHHRGHIWVSVMNHGKTVSPTGPESRLTGARRIAQTHSAHGRDAVAFDVPYHTCRYGQTSPQPRPFATCDWPVPTL